MEPCAKRASPRKGAEGGLAKGPNRTSKGAPVKTRCQVPDCKANMDFESFKNVRLRVCGEHEKAVAVDLYGEPSRFCQQCAKFHLVTDFNGNNRGCRKRLEKHNERRKMKTKNKRIVRDMEEVVHRIIDVKRKGKSDLNTAGSLSRELAELEPADIVESLFGGGVIPDASAHGQLPASTGQNFEAPCESSVAGTNVPVGNLQRSELKRVRHVSSASPWSTTSTGSSHLEETRTSGPAGLDTCAMSSLRSISSESWPAQGLNADQIINMSLEGNYQCVGSSADGWGSRFLEQSNRFAPSQSAAALETTMDTHCAMTLKIVGVTPGCLPEHLYEEITSWLQVPPSAIQGSIRPGCIHLTVDMWFNSATDAASAARNAPVGFARSVTSGDARLPWCSCFTQLLVGSTLVVADCGCVISEGALEHSRRPALSLADSSVALQRGTVQLLSDCSRASKASTLFCRVGGFYRDVVIKARTELDDDTAVLTVKLPSDIGLSTAWFELCDLTSKQLSVSPSVPVLLISESTVHYLQTAVSNLLRSVEKVFREYEQPSEKCCSCRKPARRCLEVCNI